MRFIDTSRRNRLQLSRIFTKSLSEIAFGSSHLPQTSLKDERGSSTMPFDPVSYRQRGDGSCREGRRARSVGARAGATLLRVALAVRHFVVRCAAIRQLRRLDDHLLRDIGIERAAIADAVDTMIATAERHPQPRRIAAAH
jgi:uncharacterized protein YjiS (DUF1127 family)